MKQPLSSSLRKEIKYIGFYDSPNSSQKRAAGLAATNKMDYVCDALERSGYCVQLISPSWLVEPAAKWVRQTTISLGPNKKLTMCPSFGTKNDYLLYLKIAFSLTWLFIYLVLNVRRGETVIVYNATWLSISVRAAKFLKGYRYLLEVEEINGEIWKMKKFLRRQEEKLVANADCFIFASDILAERLRLLGKSSIVLYGSYSVGVQSRSKNQEKVMKPSKDVEINIVFVGSVDRTKSGASVSVQCARYLPKNYKIHILAYGNHNYIEQLMAQISEVNTNLGREACRYHGVMVGSKLSEFLQNCDIAINPQREGAYMETAFPSKILTYLTNNLRVVSTKIESIQRSRLSSLVNFSINDRPKEIAKAILNMNLAMPIDNQSIVEQLDQEFIVGLREILECHA